MWTHMLVVAAVVIIACGQLAIYHEQIAEDLKVTCAYTNVTADNVSFVSSLVISKSVDGHNQVLASINSIRGTIKVYGTDAQVTGHMYIYHSIDAIVVIKWTNSNYRLNGDYSCTLYGLDQYDEEMDITQKLSIQLQDADPEIQATPSHIVDGFTPSLIVECSLANLAVYDTSELLQVEISQSENETSRLIARLNGTILPTKNNTDSLADGWEVISSYFEATSAYLSVKRPRPTTKDSGQYTCDVSTSNSTSRIVKSVDVTASAVSTQQYVYDILTDQESLQDYYLFACNFEHGICGLNLSGPSYLSSWTLLPDRLRGQGLHNDVPGEDAFGHYLTLEVSSLRAGYPFTIGTKLIPSIRRRICISFWLLASNVGELNIYTRQNGVLYKVYYLYDYYKTSWNQIDTSIPPIAQPFNVIIEFKSSTFYTGFIAVDDLIISDFNCK